MTTFIDNIDNDWTSKLSQLTAVERKPQPTLHIFGPRDGAVNQLPQEPGEREASRERESTGPSVVNGELLQLIFVRHGAQVFVVELTHTLQHLQPHLAGPLGRGRVVGISLEAVEKVQVVVGVQVGNGTCQHWHHLVLQVLHPGASASENKYKYHYFLGSKSKLMYLSFPTIRCFWI